MKNLQNKSIFVLALLAYCCVKAPRLSAVVAEAGVLQAMQVVAAEVRAPPVARRCLALQAVSLAEAVPTLVGLVPEQAATAQVAQVARVVRVVLVVLVVPQTIAPT
jgi:hypothetical protein